LTQLPLSMPTIPDSAGSRKQREVTKARAVA
jgi:hypothetical protein